MQWYASSGAGRSGTCASSPERFALKAEPKLCAPWGQVTPG
jgi:hypothetical protein